jgi:putative transposase
MTKVEKIKQTIKEIKERRESLSPVVYQLKIQNLSRAKEEKLNRVFLEAKWLYNWFVADINRVNISTKEIKEVEIRVGDGFEKREIKCLGSQLKQAVQERVKDNLRVLKILEKKGYKVGRLKFKKMVSSINLKQYKISFDVDFERNKVRIQRLGWFRVLGLHQVPRDCEIANAQLIKKPSGYFVHLTCYVKKEYFEKDKVRDAVGIDFGVTNKLTLSNSLLIDFEVKESKRLKKLQRELARKKKGSKNREKVLRKLQREYERLTNIRRDIHNKLLALFRHYGVVVYQDDNIKAWHEGWFGSQIQHAGIGMLKAKLRNNLATIPVKRFEATTQECCVCGWKQKLSLSARIYHCPVCGETMNRDLNSAINILKKGLDLSPNQVVGADHPELTPVERVLVTKILGSNPYIKVTVLVEAGSPHFYEWGRRSPREEEENKGG